MVRHVHAGPSARAAAKQAQEDVGIVGVVPLLAVLVAVVASVYLVCRQGSAGASEGGVVGGSALLAGAAVRFLLPERAAGLLATRKRLTDVVTLAAFGAVLLITGLALPY